MTLARLTKRLEILAKQVEGAGPRAVRMAAVAADLALVNSTPVDTGRARSNWIVTIGQPSDDVREPVSLQESLSAAEGTIKKVRQGDAVYITNNLPYIQRLNDGYSAQAPAGFVQEAVAAALEKIRRDFNVFDEEG